MRVLFIGAHTDDIELGAGGTLLKLLKDKKHKVSYLTFSRCEDIPRNKHIREDQECIQKYLEDNGAQVIMLDLPNRCLHKEAQQIREFLEGMRDNFKPDLIFSHWIGDIHQDHKVIAEESIRVFRHHSLLSYECPRSCSQFVPNYFYSLNDREIQSKVELLALYKSQKDLYYISPTLIKSLAIVRGANIGKEYAEGFTLNQIILE